MLLYRFMFGDFELAKLYINLNENGILELNYKNIYITPIKNIQEAINIMRNSYKGSDFDSDITLEGDNLV